MFTMTTIDVPPGATKVVADLADPDCAEAIFAAAAGLPPVRLLVNNAARFAWDGPGEFDRAEFDAHMAVNVARAGAADRAASRQRHDGGTDALVVNLLDSKLAAPNPDYLSYTLSKQALAGADRTCSRARSRARRIRVNGVAPALMLRSSGQSDEQFRRRCMPPTRLRRGVEPEDVVAAIRYLAGAPLRHRPDHYHRFRTAVHGARPRRPVPGGTNERATHRT